MVCSLTTPISSASHSSNAPIDLTETSTMPMIEEVSSKIQGQLLPANLRLNDDILSIHFNNVTSNIKKRHSFSDSIDILTKYLPSNVEFQQKQINVLDDLSIISSSSDTKTIESISSNLPDQDLYMNDGNSDGEEQQTIIESFVSGTESEGSLSEGIESIVSIAISIKPSNLNLKSLLKTSTTPKNTTRRVSFDPLALLLDAAAIGELELVMKLVNEVRFFICFSISFNNYLFVQIFR